MHDRAYIAPGVRRVPESASRQILKVPAEPPLAVMVNVTRLAVTPRQYSASNRATAHHLLACRWRVRGRLNSSGQRLHVRSRAPKAVPCPVRYHCKMTLASFKTHHRLHQQLRTISAASSTVFHRPICVWEGPDNARHYQALPRPSLPPPLLPHPHRRLAAVRSRLS